MTADFLDADAVRNWLTAPGHSDLAVALPSDLAGISIGSAVTKIDADAQVFALVAKILGNNAKAHHEMARFELNLAGELMKRCPRSNSMPTDTG